MKIAFSGRSGAGKDFLAKELINNHSYVRASFSDQVKKLCNIIYPWVDKDYPPIIKETKQVVNYEGVTYEFIPREMWIGIDFLRQKDKYIYIRMLEKELSYLMVDNVVITDIRTKEELEFCKSNDYKIIYIESSKHIYDNNDFDNFTDEVRNVSDYIFINDHNGLLKFKEFIKKELNEN